MDARVRTFELTKKLRDYYNEKIKDNVYYPVTKNNYHKLFEYVITIDGLKVFHELKRQFIMDDKSLTPTELLKLGMLWNSYASTNRNKKEMLELDNYILRVSKRVNRKTRINLLEEGLIIINKDYDPKQMEYHLTWRKIILWRTNDPDPNNPHDYCDKCNELVWHYYGYSDDDDLHLCLLCSIKFR